jgi:glycosyltransferase involved in cell wall biosynthesis
VIVILGDGPEKQNLYRLAERYNIADFEIRVSQQIGTYLSAADLYVSTSSTESFGMANCEALMAGLPSVCTNVGAVAELLKNGAILTSDDPEEIATSIIKVLENNKIRDELIGYSREVTSNWPTPSDIADKFERILSDCK